MITCSNCGRANNLMVQPLDPPFSNSAPTNDMPDLLNPITNIQLEEDNAPNQFSSPYETLNPLIPQVLANPPFFEVPANPLLPEGYREILDYNSLQYLNGFLRTQIGKFVEAEFLVGSTNTVMRAGRLVGVGINYILLEEMTSNTILTCDFYNLKFVRFYEN